MISPAFGISGPKTETFYNETSGKTKTHDAFYREKVLSVRHWTDTLFSFTATRDSGFRFQNGQFAMIGLEVEGRPLLRAYSMASANHEEELEFFSIKVAGWAADLEAAEDPRRRRPSWSAARPPAR